MISKVAKRLDGWKMNFLFKGGRLTLIEVVFYTIPTCYPSLIRLSSGVNKKLEKIMRNFFGRVRMEMVGIIWFRGR